MEQLEETWSNSSLSRLPILYQWISRIAKRYAVALAVLLLALANGVLYMVIVPPWQHYDEPTHFEYAWLIANTRRLPLPGETDQIMRREVAASMLEHGFFRNLSNKPDLLNDTGVIEIGISEVVHPPAYYVLLSLPLRLLHYLDITTQLYVARAMSVALFVLTIAVALGLMRDLTPQHHILRLAVPTALALLPPFVDIMTAVNNDVGAVLLFSLFLWISVRIIRYGVTGSRSVALLGSVALGVATKNTASVSLLLVPLVVLLSIWSQRRWQWKWFMLAAGGLLTMGGIATFSWGDSALWYRGTSQIVQSAPTRLFSGQAPVGKHTLQLEAPAATGETTLFQPLLADDVAQIAGEEITAGAWFWADEPITSTILSIDYSSPMSTIKLLSAEPITITTTPTFVSWQASIPREAEQLHYRVTVRPTTSNRKVRVYVDGAVLVQGHFSPGTTPTFSDYSATRGRWESRPINNLVRNGSSENAWPRIQTWIDQGLIKYARRSPQQIVSALFDIQRTGQTLLYEIPSQVLFSFFGSFGWGASYIPQEPWIHTFQFVLAIAALGFCRAIWLLRSAFAPHAVPAVVFLGSAGVLVWGNVIFRVLPLLDSVPVYPVARYGFPAILPAMIFIVGGWWALIPVRLRQAGVLGLVGGFLVLNVSAAVSIWSFYQV